MAPIDFDGIAGLLASARDAGRDALYEHECYRLLAAAGLAIPDYRFIGRDAHPRAADLAVLPGERVVLKIVADGITHKTEARGVCVVAKELGAVREAFDRMLAEVPGAWAAHLAARAGEGHEVESDRRGEGGGAGDRGSGGGDGDSDIGDRGPAADALQARVAEGIRGVLAVGFVESDARGLGTELFIGIRDTREFGPVISAGLGGTDMETLAARLHKGAAVAMAPTALVDGRRFFELFQSTLAYQRLAGALRGTRRLVDDEELVATFQRLLDIADHSFVSRSGAALRLCELEVNPWVASGGRLVPLDGVCSFGPARRAIEPRPRDKIDRLLHPRSAAVIGVSATGMNMGRIILRNLLAAGFDRSRAWVVRDGVREIEGAMCVPSIAALPEKVDLFVVAVGAAQVREVVEELLDHDRAHAVILIPGGLGEKEGSHSLERELQLRIRQARGQSGAGAVFLGGNSMGVVSHPGRYDTWFIPEDKLVKSCGEHRRPLAFVSQSGAFIIANLSAMPWLDPAYALSIGNQIDLTAGDLVAALRDDPQIEVLAVYVEGFRDGDGLALARAVAGATAAGKDVVFYKAGRTREGRSATAGHTASVAGDYAVCEAALVHAGALVARDFDEFGDLLRLALRLRGVRRSGACLAALSNAGFEAVGMADALRVGGASLPLARFAPDTMARLEVALAAHRLDGLVDAKNPLDVTPMASDAAFCELAGHMLADPGVDVLVASFVPLTPAMQTLPGPAGAPGIDHPDSIAQRLPAVARASGKPVVAVVAAGSLFDPLVARLEAGGLPVFRSADRAVRALVRYL